MAKCGSCGEESRRIRTSFLNGTSKDECPHCAPQSFEKIADPSTKKVWIGPEFAPNDYEWRDGYLQMKPEAVADLEERSCGTRSVAYQEEMAKVREAEEHKRHTRRTKPLSPNEIASALDFCDQALRPLIEDTETAYEV